MKTLFLLILFVTQAFGAAVVDPKQQRFTELTAVLNQNFDDQTLDSLIPYQPASYQELTSLNLNSFDEHTWQTILRDIPASMSTGASNPAKLGKAIAHIKQYLESMTKPGIVAERKAATELKRKEELVRQLEPKIQKLPFDQQEPSRIALRNLTVEQLYDKVRTMVMEERSGR